VTSPQLSLSSFWCWFGAITLGCALPDITSDYSASIPGAGANNRVQGGATTIDSTLTGGTRSTLTNDSSLAGANPNSQRGGNSTQETSLGAAGASPMTTHESAGTQATLTLGGTASVSASPGGGASSNASAGKASSAFGGTTAIGGAGGTAAGTLSTLQASGGRGQAGSAGGPSAGASLSEGGQSSAGAANSAAGASNPACPATGGPSMVKLPKGFCIDSTEVTRDQYTAWLNRLPAPTMPPSSDPICGWKSNASYAPNATCMANAEYVCQGAGCGNHPQVCVDFCDAIAYCASVNKRLCGRVSGGSNAFAEYTYTGSSQWYNACTSGGQNTYPYGSTYVGSQCDGYDLTNGLNYGTRGVGSMNGCVPTAAAFAGIFDLSGNVAEWEDSCEGSGQAAVCHVRGGSFISSKAYLACDNNESAGRGTSNWAIGFRCCMP
jgi:formylglycine-generating enzyme required for sulfatase activity